MQDAKGAFEPSTAALLREGGSERALERLFERYREPLRRWAGLRLADAGVREREIEAAVRRALADAVHELKHLPSAESGAFHARLREAALDQVRRTPSAGFAPSPLQAVAGAELIERYEKALGAMTDAERELLFVRMELGLSYERLAGILGEPDVAAVRNAVASAVVRLGWLLGGDESLD